MQNFLRILKCNQVDQLGQTNTSFRVLNDFYKSNLELDKEFNPKMHEASQKRLIEKYLNKVYSNNNQGAQKFAEDFAAFVKNYLKLFQRFEMLKNSEQIDSYRNFKEFQNLLEASEELVCRPEVLEYLFVHNFGKSLTTEQKNQMLKALIFFSVELYKVSLFDLTCIKYLFDAVPEGILDRGSIKSVFPGFSDKEVYELKQEMIKHVQYNDFEFFDDFEAISKNDSKGFNDFMLNSFISDSFSEEFLETCTNDEANVLVNSTFEETLRDNLIPKRFLSKEYTELTENLAKLEAEHEALYIDWIEDSSEEEKKLTELELQIDELKAKKQDLELEIKMIFNDTESSDKFKRFKSFFERLQNDFNFREKIKDNYSESTQNKFKYSLVLTDGTFDSNYISKNAQFCYNMLRNLRNRFEDHFHSDKRIDTLDVGVNTIPV